MGLSYDHILGLRFAVNVGISTVIVWIILQVTDAANAPLAVGSMIAASDPLPKEARRTFRARLISSVIGCSVGLFFIVIGEPSKWMLPIALAITVLITTVVVRIKTMWLQAPITAALVIGTSIVHGSAATGIGVGLRRVGEIFLACLVGLTVSWIMSKIWLIREHDD